jgi:hypothetical protein
MNSPQVPWSRRLAHKVTRVHRGVTFHWTILEPSQPCLGDPDVEGRGKDNGLKRQVCGAVHLSVRVASSHGTHDHLLSGRPESNVERDD